MAQHFSELINIQIIINYSVANHPGHNLHLYNQADLPPIESGEPYTHATRWTCLRYNQVDLPPIQPDGPSTNATLGPFPHAKAHHTDNQHITKTFMEEPHFQAGVWHTTFRNLLTLK